MEVKMPGDWVYEGESAFPEFKDSYPEPSPESWTGIPDPEGEYVYVEAEVEPTMENREDEAFFEPVPDWKTLCEVKFKFKFNFKILYCRHSV